MAENNSLKRREILYFDRLIDNQKIYDEFDDEANKMALELMKINSLPSGSLIVDIGCGSGAWGNRIARMGYTVIGTDISSKMAKSAYTFAKNANANFYPVCADAENMPFKSNSFDCVFFGFSVHHIPHISSAFKEASRCLKHSGRVILIDPNGSNPVMKISSILGKILNLIVKIGLSSPAERAIPTKNILWELERNNLKIVETLWLFHVPKSLGAKSFQNLLIDCYFFALKIAHKLLPEHLGATRFIVTAAKER